MTNADNVFAGSVPEMYNRYLGPLLFESYAADLAERVKDMTAGRLLETAAGTGIVTRALARSLPGAVSIVATDLNQPMLDFAATQPGAEGVIWQQADALHLPFPDQTFDVVVCQFGVMFFPDKIAAFREAHRVLKATGRFIFSVWDRIEENEVSRVVVESVSTLFPGDPPQFLARTPYGYHNCDRIQEDLLAAEFKRIDFEKKQLQTSAPSATDIAIGLCQGSPLRNEIEERSPGKLEGTTEALARAVARRFGDGPITGKMQAFVFTAAK
jgi:ubiquinone/menaquinone biosynthesis C-methylase UbiE